MTSLAALDGLAEALREDQIGTFEQASDFAACLMPLLTALGWVRDADTLLRALPHVAERIDLIDFRNIMAELGYVSERTKGSATNIDPRLVPALFVADDGTPLVILSHEGKEVVAYDSRDRTIARFRAKHLQGYFYIFALQDDTPSGSQESFIGKTMRRFRRDVWLIGIASVLSSVFGLIVPVFVLTVYDTVIPAGSPNSLYWLLPGLGLALLVDFLLRQIRGAAVAQIAGRLDFLISTEIFRKILSLPPSGSESSTIGDQISRFRGFQGVRDLLNSPAATLVLETPLIVLATLVIWIVAPPLVMVPLGALAVTGIISLGLLPAISRAEAQAGIARAQRDQMATEIVGQQRNIRATVLGATFMDRIRPLSARAAMERLKAAQLNLTLQSVLQGVLLLSGLATLYFGAHAVIEQTITTGALVASMALVTRILQPIQLGLQSLPRITQMRGTIDRIDRLMRAKSEDNALDNKVAGHRFSGMISIRRLSVRYAPTSDPALLAISFDVLAGQMVAITGPSGSGKSTLLSAAAGLLKPQAGSISFGGVEVRHLSPTEHRRYVGYLAQRTDLFRGSIAQNLRLARPNATFEELRAATERAGLLDEIDALPDGFDTLIGDERSISIPESFQQKLSIARLWLKDCPVMLLDEPSQNLDALGDEKLMTALEQLKGNRTVVFVTHRPSAMRLADRVFEMTNGRLIELKKDQLPGPGATP
jgi:ATP-binding cassette subfamily C protein/ATP-binding cassette subfamily C protein LapB